MLPPMTDSAGKRTIHFLGGANILAGGLAATGRATHRHRLALLALLIANEGHAFTRDKLIGYLWPEKDSEGARNLLKVSVHELRKEFGDAAIRTSGDQLSANLAALDSDLGAFLAALEAKDDRRAAAAYAGPFLDGFFLKDAEEFQRWVEDERARLGALYATALERLAASAESEGDHREAAKWRRMSCAHDPYRLESADRLVRALVSVGDVAAAIQFAESFARRRRDDLGIEDDGALMRLARSAAGTPAAPESPMTAKVAVRGSSAGTLAASADSGSTAAAGRAHPRRVSFGGVAAATVLAAAAALAWYSLRGPRPAADRRVVAESVAIAPFGLVGANSPASSRDGLTELLAARFTGKGGGRAIDPRRAAAAWARTAPPPGAPALEAAIRQARDLGASQLVIGEIAGSRDTAEYAARLYSVASGALLSSASVSLARSRSLALAADRLAVRLMAGAAGEPAERMGGLAERPPEAVRAYLEGELAYRSSRYADAERLYASALDADSTFAMAGMQLALANSWTTIDENYGRGRDVALKFQASLSARDRAFVRAFFGPDPALGPAKPAPVYLAAWEDVVEKWPDWAEAWYQLGDRYYHYGSLSGLADPLDRARGAFRRALAEDSTLAAPLHHLLEIYAARGETDELRKTADRYFAANPAVSRTASAIGWETAAALGDSAWLSTIRRGFAAVPREDLTRIAWVTMENGWANRDAIAAESLLVGGATTTSEHEKALVLRWGQALNDGRGADAQAAARALGALFPGRPVDALWDLYASLFAAADSAAGMNAVARLDAFVGADASGDHVARDQHHLALCVSGYWRAGHGDIPGASALRRRLDDELRTEDNSFALRNAQVCGAMLSAAIAVAGRRPDASRQVAALDTILLRERVPPHVILAVATLASSRLHAALGEHSQALVAARRREHLTGDPLLLAEQRRTEKALSP